MSPSPRRFNLETIVLAAGMSRRMGATNKLLIKIEGEPLIRRAVKLYLGRTRRVTVVVGHESDRIKSALQGHDVTFATNTDFEQGQISSVLCGLKAAHNDGDGVALALGDLPLLTPADIEDVFAFFQKNAPTKIVVPYWRKQRGHPVIFPTVVSSLFKDGSPQTTPRRYIDDNPQDVCEYDAPNAHFVTDLDTPDDLAGVTTTKI